MPKGMCRNGANQLHAQLKHEVREQNRPAAEKKGQLGVDELPREAGAVISNPPANLMQGR